MYNQFVQSSLLQSISVTLIIVGKKILTQKSEDLGNLCIPIIIFINTFFIDCITHLLLHNLQ
jgi:hypothetical protein